MAPSINSFNRYSIFDFRNFCAIAEMNPDGTKHQPNREPRDHRYLNSATRKARDRSVGLAEPVD
jgi:hypothetical protein